VRSPRLRLGRVLVPSAKVGELWWPRLKMTTLSQFGVETSMPSRQRPFDGAIEFTIPDEDDKGEGKNDLERWLLGQGGGREISLCAGRRIRRSECGRKSRPAPFEMTMAGDGRRPLQEEKQEDSRDWLCHEGQVASSTGLKTRHYKKKARLVVGPPGSLGKAGTVTLRRRWRLGLWHWRAEGRRRAVA